MAKRDLLRDSSSHASGELDYALRKPETDATPRVSVDEALQESRLMEHSSDRNVTRVLFISQDTRLLDPSKQTLDGYINVADMFDEVHILVLRTGLAPRQPVLRPNSNVWIYTVAAPNWWQLPKAAKKLLESQLMFATGFRPDLIVARDPLESGLIALQAAKTYSRPAQLHVTHSSYEEMGMSVGFFHRLLDKYTIPRFMSVRVANKKIWNKIQSTVKTKDFAVLPRLNPYESILNAPKKIDLHKNYPQYIFNMLFVGSLEEGSSVLEVISAAAGMLKNTSVSLIIIGDGPLHYDCKNRAKALGIEKQIIYLPSTVNVVQYLKAAHVLFVTDTDEFSEDIIMKASYAQIPMLLSGTQNRLELFTHLESAYFCESHEIEMLAEGLSILMNDVSLRQHMAERALAEVKGLFHEDPKLYQRRYRESIEQAIFADEQK